MRELILDTKEKMILESLQYLENEEATALPLGGMAWDDVGLFAFDLMNNYDYSDEKLKELFPHLFGWK